ncbi:MAG: hypothetical protein ABWX94_02135 [Candidatus Saccharimonadales bacterium]
MQEVTSIDNDELSKEQIAQVVDLLSKLKPGFLPFDIFHQVARLVAIPIIELVPLRINPEGNVEILLLKREADDPVWPDRLHVPGTVIRASDTSGSFDDPLSRISSQELMDSQISEPMFVRNILHHSDRGMEVSQVLWVEVQGETSVGEFYDVDHLPISLVQSQLDFIPDAVAHFKKIKLGKS